MAGLQIWIKICNLKDGGFGDKDRERRGDITIIRASSFAHKPKLCPQHHPQNSLWSVVTPIKPAKLSLSSQAADLRTYCQQIWLGEGLRADNRCPSPSSPIWNQSHRLSHSVSPTLPVLLSSDTGLGPAPNRVLMLKSSVLLSGRVPPWTHCPSLSIHVRVELLLKEHHVMSPQRSCGSLYE